eukprot:TRINITY_DN45184_c0_g1_i1.p1 TRINITY_DN45184_c0_g1~~TRINITY_DN45184_c0_g1_i1.p1  ORF type:complete len:483 (+),score=87.14 TRINITY_DN45184_c0_g1_i1:110-1558(+)
MEEATPKAAVLGQAAVASPFRCLLGVGGRCSVADTAKALSALAAQPFFEDLDARHRQAVLDTACEISCAADTILFQEGDPAHAGGCCYVVLQGTVGLFRREDAKKVEDSDVHTASPSQHPRPRTAPAAAMLLAEWPQLPGVPDTVPIEKSSSRDFEEPDAAAAAEASGQLRRGAQTLEDWELSRLMFTAEGFSTWPAGRELGIQVGEDVEPGICFGQSAILKPEQARAYTACCMEPAELLVLQHPKSSPLFLSDEQLADESRKLEFLREHLPGVRQQPHPDAMPSGRIHPVRLFSKVAFPKGHVFFKQGVVADSALYVMISGAAEVLYKQQTQSLDIQRQLPTCQEALRVQQAKRAASAKKPPRTSMPAARRADISGSRKGYQVVVYEEGSFLLSSLGAGAVFGSSPLTGAVEPFTIVAKQSCEVYMLPPAEMGKLSLTMAEFIREHVSSTTRFRLERLKRDRSERASYCNASKEALAASVR